MNKKTANMNKTITMRQVQKRGLDKPVEEKGIKYYN